MFLFLLPLLISSCDYMQKYWCDVFNGRQSCYSHIMCSSYGPTVSLSDALLSKFGSSLSSLLHNSSCVYSQFVLCKYPDWDDYIECVKVSQCEDLLRPAFLSKLPESVWVAVQPRGLYADQLDDDDYEAYRNFQKCIRSCEEVCEAADDENDRECIENCVLIFCV